MKQFFEQYGGVVLGILALLVLIAMITPVGNIIKTSLQGTVQTFSSSINSQTDDMDKQLQEAFNNAVADLTHINTTYVKGDFSAKGNIVKINGEDYKVLDSSGYRVEVLKMEPVSSTSFNNGETVNFGSVSGIKYQNSILDNAMATFYNALPLEVQSLLIEQNISQSIYRRTTTEIADYDLKAPGYNAYTYYLKKMGEVQVGNRKVYILDVDDVIKYVGSNPSLYDINNMFFDKSEAVGVDLWLRTASSTDETRLLNVNGTYCSLFNDDKYTINNHYQPAFIIDLSLLQN